MRTDDRSYRLSLCRMLWKIIVPFQGILRILTSSAYVILSFIVMFISLFRHLLKSKQSSRDPSRAGGLHLVFLLGFDVQIILNME